MFLSSGFTLFLFSYLCPCLSDRRRKREAHINWYMVTCKGSTRYWNYIEDYWSCAGVLSAVNAIGTQLRDPIKAGGLTRWRTAVQINGRRRGNREESHEEAPEST